MRDKDKDKVSKDILRMLEDYNDVRIILENREIFGQVWLLQVADWPLQRDNYVSVMVADGSLVLVVAKDIKMGMKFHSDNTVISMHST